MKPSVLESKDFWAGAMLIATGSIALFFARNYAFGNSLRMGPGYFPIVLGSILILFGLYIAATGLRESSEKIGGPWLPRMLVTLPLMATLICVMVGPWAFAIAAAVLIACTALAAAPLRKDAEGRRMSLAGTWSPRALILLPLSLVLFGVLIDRAGFIPAMLVLVFGSATAGREFKPVEALLFAAFMTAICTVVFVWALGLPYPLIAGW